MPESQHLLGERVSAVVLYVAWSQSGAADRLPVGWEVRQLWEPVWSAITALSDDPIIIAGEVGTPPRRLSDEAGTPYRHLLGESAPAGARIVPDTHPHLWPVGAVLAGLLAARHERVLVVTSDMLLLNLALLRYMILLSADYHMVVPRLGGNPEPLHAVYSRACVRPLERALSRGDQGISAILAGLRVRYVEDSEVETFDVNHLSFSRVQSGHDWEWAQKQLQRRKR